MTSPLSQIALVYDLDQALASLRAAAKHHAVHATYLPRDLMCAAVAFTVQLAIESNHDSNQLRELERQLIAHIDTVDSLNHAGPRDSERMTATDTGANMGADKPDRLTTDKIINVRNRLLAMGDIGSLSVPDQNLFRDCDIALGVVRCRPETRKEARERISRYVGALKAEARALQALGAAASKRQAQELDRQLRGVLGDIDPFWVQWSAFVEGKGGGRVGPSWMT